MDLNAPAGAVRWAGTFSLGRVMADPAAGTFAAAAAGVVVGDETHSCAVGWASDAAAAAAGNVAGRESFITRGVSRGAAGTDVDSQLSLAGHRGL